MRDLRTAVRLNGALLPAAHRRRLSRLANVNNALGTIRRSHRILRAGEVRIPLIQLREALRTSASPRVVLRAVLLLAHCLWAVVRGGGRVG